MSKRFALALLTAVLITALLYARSLSLPLYSDDLVQLPWVREATWGQIWGSISPYGYYRPLVFTLWRLLPDSLVILRLLNLSLHTIAAALVGHLAGSLSDKNNWLTSVSAAALFAGYPFAYQVVPWVSAAFYPSVVVLSVLAVIAYRHARGGGHWGWWIVSVLSTMLAPLAHENGLFTGLLVALSEPFFQDTRRHMGWPLVHLIASAISGIVWLQVRRAGLSTLALDPTELVWNAAFLVQGLSFPLAPIAQIFDGDIWAIWAVAVPTIAALTWAAGRPGRYGIGWLALNVIPAWVMMRPAWLADAPRFLYPAGVGAALVWGLALGRLAGCKRTRQATGITITLVALAPGAYFVWEGVTWHLRGGTAIREAVDAAQMHPDSALLLVNLPDRLMPSRSCYPLNHGGAILLPPQVPPDEIVDAHTNVPRRQDNAITAGWILPPVDYERTTYGPLVGSPAELAEILSDDYIVYVTEYVDTNIHLREAGRILPEQPPPDSLVARFDGSLTLASAQAQVDDDALYLRLVWALESSLPGGETVFVHVVDEQGNVIAQVDGDPLMGLYPLSTWSPGTTVLDVRHVQLAGSIPSEIYVGVWRPDTGGRLKAVASDGTLLPDDRVPIYNLP